MSLLRRLWHRVTRGKPVTFEDILAELIESGCIGSQNPNMITQTRRDDERAGDTHA